MCIVLGNGYNKRLEPIMIGRCCACRQRVARQVRFLLLRRLRPGLPRKVFYPPASAQNEPSCLAAGLQAPWLGQESDPCAAAKAKRFIAVKHEAGPDFINNTHHTFCWFFQWMAHNNVIALIRSLQWKKLSSLPACRLETVLYVIWTRTETLTHPSA